MSSTTSTGPADLLPALAALAGAEALTVGADGFNPHFQYAYMTEEALFKAARAALAEVGLSGTISFEAGQHETVLMTTERGGEKNQTLATVTAVLTIRDVNGQHVEVRAFGQGLDPADKAYAKAMTMAAKYVVQKGMMIGVEHGDDTDAGGNEGASRARSGGGTRSAGGAGGAASEKQLGFLCALVKKGHYIEGGTSEDVEHVALRLARMEANDATIPSFAAIPRSACSTLLDKLNSIPAHRSGEVLEKLAAWEAENPAPTAQPTAEAEAAASPTPAPPAAAPSDDDDIPF